MTGLQVHLSHEQVPSCGGVTWKVVRIQEVERNEAMCSRAAIRIKERMALNEMKIWTTLV